MNEGGKKLLDAAREILPEGYEVIRKGSAPIKTALLTMGEVCDILGISRPTLWRMIKAGGIQKTEIYKGAFRIKRSELDRFLDK